MSYMSKKIKEDDKINMYSALQESYEITEKNIASKFNNSRLKKHLCSCLASYMKAKLYEAFDEFDTEDIEDTNLDSQEIAQIDQIADRIVDTAPQNSIEVEPDDAQYQDDQNAIDDQIHNADEQITNESVTAAALALGLLGSAATGIVTLGYKGIKSLMGSSNDPTVANKIQEVTVASPDKATQMGGNLIDYIKNNPRATAGYALGAAALIYLIKKIVQKKQEKRMQESVVNTLITLKNINEALDETNRYNMLEVVKYIAESMYQNL